MKNFGLALLISALAACSGGGGSGGAIPTPQKTPQHTVSFAFSSLGTKTQARHFAACGSSVSAPTALQAEANWNPPAGASWSAIEGNSVSAVEYDANCNVISSSATLSVSDPNLVSSTIPGWIGGSLPSPSPGSTYIFGENPGTATITATFPDTTTASTTVHVYGQIGVGCSVYYYLGANGTVQRGWTDIAGETLSVNACGWTVSSPVAADMQMDEVQPSVDFPMGYEIVEQNGAPIADFVTLTSCASFASQGTMLNLSQNLVPPLLLLFKTNDGKCVKMFTQGVTSGSIVGLYSISDASGNFSN